MAKNIFQHFFISPHSIFNKIAFRKGNTTAGVYANDPEGSEECKRGCVRSTDCTAVDWEASRRRCRRFTLSVAQLEEMGLVGVERYQAGDSVAGFAAYRECLGI